jgi:CRP-like cAMP-binding protein
MEISLSADCNYLKNKILAALPGNDFRAVMQYLRCALVPSGAVLLEPGDEVTQVFFPINGAISLRNVMEEDGKAVETAIVGCEGLVGFGAVVAGYKSTVRFVAQNPLEVSKIASSDFRNLSSRIASFRDLTFKYNNVLLSRAQAMAACNLVHSAEARLCRWLLQASDALESTTIEATQAFLAETLGLGRSSIGLAAVAMQEAKLITYSRGKLTILDRSALERCACECYQNNLIQ